MKHQIMRMEAELRSLLAFCEITPPGNPTRTTAILKAKDIMARLRDTRFGGWGWEHES